MASVDDGTRIAAALAIKLLEARPDLGDDRTAAQVAWDTFRDAERSSPTPLFQRTIYMDDVLRIMDEIRAGTHEAYRIQSRPPHPGY